MKKLFSYLMFLVLVLQAVTPGMSVQAKPASAERMPAGLHLAVLDAVAEEAQPFQATPEGYTLQGHALDVQLRDGHFSAQAQEQSAWRFDLHLSGIGRGEQVVSLQQTGTKKDKTGQVEYQYPGVVEWYRNTTLGVQQGFTIAEKPHGNGKLVLQLALNTSLSGSLSQDERSLSFDTRDGRTLRYAGLRVFDANLVELEARLVYTPKQVVIEVKDLEATYPLTIDPLIYLEQKVLAADGAASDFFGVSVALSGNTALVGAYLDDAPSTNQGSAYIFERDVENVWHQKAKLSASDGAASDFFAASVALFGDTALVGAPGGNSIRGIAYVFVKPAGGWQNMTETAKLTASDGAAGDGFGYAVALSDDTALVGAYANDAPAANQGSAYVFVKPAGGWGNMTQTAKLATIDGGMDDYFGWSVAISGSTALVGAYGDDSASSVDQGSAYIFNKPTSGWANTSTYTAKLSASDGAEFDRFGYAVALSGDTALVGAYGDTSPSFVGQGSAYVFVKPAGEWGNMTQTAKLTASDGAAFDSFGWSVALAGDTALVGAYGDDGASSVDQGSAYVFNKPTSGWVNTSLHTAKLSASDGAASDFFAASVALSGDTALVGANSDDAPALNQGSAYFYQSYLYDDSYDLDVDAAVSNPAPSVGGSVQLTARVLNYGPASPIALVVLNAPVPAELTYVSHLATHGTYNPTTGVWSTGNLGLGVSATLTITARVELSASRTNQTFLATSSNTDMVASNNSASAEMSVPDPLSVSPESLSFGYQIVGTTSTTQEITVTNLAAAAITLGTVTAPTGFVLTDPCSGNPIAEASTCVIGVRFAPTAAGALAGQVTIPLVGGASLSVNVNGTGYAEYLTNNSFETDTVIPLKVPDDWTKSGTWASTDGRSCTVHRTGTCSLKFTGNGKLKSLSYTVLTGGAAGDAYLLQLYSKAAKVPKTGTTYRVSLSFMNGTTLVNKVVNNFAKGSHDFALPTGSLPISATGAYDRIIVKIEFKATAGTVWFDDASLLLAP